MERSVRCSDSNLNSAFASDNDKTCAYVYNSIKARIVVEASKLTIVVADVIRAASIEDKALLVVAAIRLTQDVVRKLDCSVAEFIKPCRNVGLCVRDYSDISGACRRVVLNLVSVFLSPLISSLVRKGEPAIIAGSNVCVLAVVAVSLQG